MIFAAVTAIFAPATVAWRKGKAFSVELTNVHLNWTAALLFKD
jgi:hypothetical protein